MNNEAMLENDESDQARRAQLAARIRQAQDETGVSNSALAAAAGVTVQAVGGWRSTGKISRDNLYVIARRLNRSIDYFLSDDNGGGAYVMPPRTTFNTAEPGPEPAMSVIPVVGDTQGGPDKHYLEYGHPPGYGDEYVDAPAKNPQTYGLRVRGASMYPRMREGDVVTVDPEAEPMPGADVVVRTNDGEVMVKELAFERDGMLALDSVTEARRTIAKDHIQFIHLVIGIHPPQAVKKRT